jgi:hypothetical protein
VKILKLQHAAAVLALSLGSAAASAADACNRSCLEGFVDRYLDAVVDDRPDRAPLAAGVRFTEDGQRLAIGDGLWNTLRARGRYRLFVTDVPAGQVTFFGSIEEDHPEAGKGTPALLALRLRVKGMQITEIEQLVIRDEKAAARVNALSPDPLYLQAVPAAERMSRTDLVATANKYFTGMQQNDGKGDYPFTEDCNRIENGMQTTNAPTPEGQIRPDSKTATMYSAQWSCLEQFQSGLLHFVNRIRDRRIVAVDQERGLVYAFAFFDHSAGSTRSFATPDGRAVTAGPVQPWTWQIAELFKIERGRIRRIEALLQRAPYGMNSGWSTWSQGLSDLARDVTMEAAVPDTSCDRQCLRTLADRYVAALVAHDPAQVPLAADVKMVENLVRIKPGEGLWKTTTGGAREYRIVVPDAVAQQVGFIVMMEEAGKPIQFGARLQLAGGRITQAEHLVVHELRETSLANLQKARAPLLASVPEAYRDSRSRLISIALSYYDALDLNNGSLAPFADDCVRYENGMQTARNRVPTEPTAAGGFGLLGALGCAKQLDTQVMSYIDTIDNRRVPIADEETGLAFGLSHFHHSMKQKELRTIGVPGEEIRKMDFKPFDLPAMHIYKIWGGQIHEIEAIGILAPYNSPTGWE